MKRFKLYYYTFIYCIGVLFFQMSPLAEPVSVHNVSSFFLFASVPVGILGLVLSIKDRNWLFAVLNGIGAVELFIAIPIIYMVSGA